MAPLTDCDGQLSVDHCEPALSLLYSMRNIKCVLDASIAAPRGHSVTIASTLVYATNRTLSTAVTLAVGVNVDTAGEVQFARKDVRTVSTGPIADSTAHARTMEYVILIQEIAGENITRYLLKRELCQLVVENV